MRAFLLEVTCAFGEMCSDYPLHIFKLFGPYTRSAVWVTESMTFSFHALFVLQFHDTLSLLLGFKMQALQKRSAKVTTESLLLCGPYSNLVLPTPLHLNLLFSRGVKSKNLTIV